MLEKIISKSLATLVVLPLLTGCASPTYSTNTLKGLESEKLTHESARYEIEGFDSGGVNYEVLEPRSFEVSGKGHSTTYHNTPAIVRTNDTLEIIDYEGKKIDVRSHAYFVLAPTISIEGFLHVAEQGDATEEITCINNYKIDEIKPRSKNFGFTTRRSNEAPFEITRMKLDDKNRVSLGENKQYIFFKNNSDIYLQGTKIHDETTRHGVLPMVFFNENAKLVIDRSKGKLCILGESYMPVRAIPIDSPIKGEDIEVESGPITSSNSTNSTN